MEGKNVLLVVRKAGCVRGVDLVRDCKRDYYMCSR